MTTPANPASAPETPEGPIKPSKTKTIFTIAFNLLFLLGAFASATQGFFSIKDFVKTLSEIPGLGFVALVPYAFIATCAVIIFLYSFTVEQQIFQPYFKKLLVSILNKFGIKVDNSEELKDYDKCSRDLQLKIAKLNEQTIDKSDAEKTPADGKANGRFNQLKTLIRSIQNHPRTQSAKKLFKTAVKYPAYVAASLILILRAIVSIGSTMLGLQALIFPLLTAFFGLSSAPAFLIPIFALMSGVGYFIKTSQNIVDQFNQTLQYFHVDVFTKKDFLNLQEEHKTKLLPRLADEIESALAKNKNLPENIKVALTAKLSHINKLKEAKKEKSQTTNKGSIFNFKVIITFVLFVFGAFGSSMSGMFSIPKFFSQMGSVPIFAFLNLIPSPIITSLGIVIALYTLFSEQRVLYPYFERLISGIINGIRSWFDNGAKPAEKPISQKIEELETKIQQLCEAYPGLNLENANKISVKKIKSEKSNSIINQFLFLPIKDFFSRLVRKLKLSDPNSKFSQIINFVYKYLYFPLAKVFTIFVLLLRAISSIVPSIFGLSATIALAAKLLFGIATIGPWVIPICTVMAITGYLIKCSQNLHNHYYKTLESLPFIPPQNNDEELQREKLRILIAIRDKNDQKLYEYLHKLNHEPLPAPAPPPPPAAASGDITAVVPADIQQQAVTARSTGRHVTFGLTLSGKRRASSSDDPTTPSSVPRSNGLPSPMMGSISGGDLSALPGSGSPSPS